VAHSSLLPASTSQLLPSPTELLEIDISIRPASDERVRTLKALGGFLVGGSIAKVDDRRHVVDHLIMVEPEDFHEKDWK
jgi:hypothetical protein